MSAEPAKPGFKWFRILAAIVAVPLSVCPFRYLRAGVDLLSAGFMLSYFIVAILCWWFAFRGHVAKDRALISFTFAGGIVIGGIGLLAGYYGPILLTQSNLGPLLGIFITGPYGFVAGALIGLCVGIIRRR
jgi:hypothetical protein